MAAPTVRKPRCSTCPYRFMYLETVPRREGGVNLQFGREYCKAGKTYRQFKAKDPKTYPPEWCPKRKIPSEFRIYAFKDVNTWYLHRCVTQSSAAPSAYQCAVRCSGTTDLSPASFLSLLEEKSASQLLGVEVRNGEVVEIDDGLKPYCFYITVDRIQVLPLWDTSRARQNTYERNESEPF